MPDGITQAEIARRLRVGGPTGWHRHPASGRRVFPEGVEYVAP